MLPEQRTIKYKGKPLFQRTKFKTPFRATGKMDDMACFFYMLDGSCQTFESSGAIKLGTNEALVKKCGNYVTHFSQGKWEVIAIFFYSDVLHEIFKNKVPSFLSKTPKIVTPKKIIANELIEKFINSLFIYFDNPELMDEEISLLKLKELVLILLKLEAQSNVHKFLSELFTPDKLKFTSTIENNIYSSVSIKELAFICNKSLSSFNREFKKVYNDTPSRYIKNQRLEYAAQLLYSTNDSISDIAFESGFQDITTFSASFRFKFNNSPSNFRLKQIRK